MKTKQNKQSSLFRFGLESKLLLKRKWKLDRILRFRVEGKWRVHC